MTPICGPARAWAGGTLGLRLPAPGPSAWGAAVASAPGRPGRQPLSPRVLDARVAAGPAGSPRRPRRAAGEVLCSRREGSAPRRSVARGHPRSDGERSGAEPKAQPFPRSRLGPRFAPSDQRRGAPRGASLRGRTPGPWPEAGAPPPSPWGESKGGETVRSA